MKTLSNAELQEAIRVLGHIYHQAHKDNQCQFLPSLQDLLNEQYRRAVNSVELTLEPIATTLERAEFDARVEAQDGPEWVDWGGGECPVVAGHDTEVRFKDLDIYRDKSPEVWRWDKTDSEGDIIAYRDWTAWEQSK